MRKPNKLGSKMADQFKGMMGGGGPDTGALPPPGKSEMAAGVGEDIGTPIVDTSAIPDESVRDALDEAMAELDPAIAQDIIGRYSA